jgi:hypothetical protein
LNGKWERPPVGFLPVTEKDKKVDDTEVPSSIPVEV